MRLRRSTGAVLLVATSLIVGGCALGGGGAPAATAPTNTVNQNLLPHLKHHGRHRAHHPRPHPAPPGVAALVRHAVAVSQAEPGLRVIAALTTRGPGVPVTGRSTMTASDAIGPGAVSAQLTVPLNRPKGGGQQSYPVRVVVRGGVMYLQPPAAFAGEVSPRGRWWAFPVSGLSSFESSVRIGQLVRATGAINDPLAYLSYAAAFAPSMNELGRATVDGIRTAHYKALATLAQSVHTLPAELAGTLGPTLDAAASAQPTGLMAVDLWIDPSHLIRRLHLSVSVAGHGGHAIELSLQQDFVSYLGVPAPAAPRRAVRPKP